MSIDLGHPDELDWMARGRRGDIRASRYSNRVSDEELEAEARDELVQSIYWRLLERGLVAEPETRREIDRVVTAIRGELAELGDDRLRRIERQVWDELDGEEPASFADAFHRRVADRIVDRIADRVGAHDVFVE